MRDEKPPLATHRASEKTGCTTRRPMANHALFSVGGSSMKDPIGKHGTLTLEVVGGVRFVR